LWRERRCFLAGNIEGKLLPAALATCLLDIGRDSFFIDVVLFFAVRASDYHFEVSGPAEAKLLLFLAKAL
jgi:hypothetical protein